MLPACFVFILVVFFLAYLFYKHDLRHDAHQELLASNPLCSVCGKNAPDCALADGSICWDCVSEISDFISEKSLDFTSVSQAKAAYAAVSVNSERWEIYNPTRSVDKYFEVDEPHRLWKTNSNPAILYSFDDVISFSLIETGDSVTSGGLGGAILGGAVAGGVGAVVGSNVASHRTQRKITEYRIRIVMRSVAFPEVYIDFKPSSCTVGGIVYNLISSQARRILSIFEVMTDSPSVSPLPSSSPADEILKYKQLFDIGAITENEFNAKKSQLLNQ